ncbi:hypothetical protein Aca07nite_64370 [Actinoplanes capillaceus]|uniref:Uncharacterized protein n=1 Tax=Actinoplanes campanulatus TaxID=113559 RepID=A0ABQ3WS92_9ACTN|nr:hypothetical protein [Actinoplanes capillaceus]GID49162.1 hypothetical protein Aca07nite_64370 [Actinoplanes capillaceus]
MARYRRNGQFTGPLARLLIAGIVVRVFAIPRNAGFRLIAVMAQIAPAALPSTFLTSLVGAATYGLLASTTTGDIAPHRVLGAPSGARGRLGGYLGARLRPHLPERTLYLLLGKLATAHFVQGWNPHSSG